jgi:hypothetical protein
MAFKFQELAFTDSVRHASITGLSVTVRTAISDFAKLDYK